MSNTVNIYFDGRIYEMKHNIPRFNDNSFLKHLAADTVVLSCIGKHQFENNQELVEGRDYKKETQFWDNPIWVSIEHLVNQKPKEGTKTRTVAVPIEKDWFDSPTMRDVKKKIVADIEYLHGPLPSSPINTPSKEEGEKAEAKAEELVGKFTRELPHGLDYRFYAKQYAITCVDEILEHIKHSSLNTSHGVIYWQQVREAIRLM